LVFYVNIFRVCDQCDACDIEDRSIHLTDANGQQLATVAKLMTCAQCHMTSYCSAACQKADWTKDKKYCHPVTHNKEAYIKCVHQAIVTSKINLAHHSFKIGVTVGVIDSTQICNQEKLVITVPLKKAHIN